jgi:hypothetical protein
MTHIEYLQQLERKGQDVVLEDLYLWPNTPIKEDLQDEILCKCGATDYESENPTSRTYKIIHQLRRMVEQHQIEDSFSVLDITCGDAVVLTQIKKSFPRCEAFGVDCLKDKFTTHEAAYREGVVLYAVYLQHLLEPISFLKKWDVVIMLNTYRGWEHARLREHEKKLPELSDRYFAEYAQYSILTLNPNQLKHFRRMGFRLKVLGEGEYHSLMVLISREPISISHVMNALRCLKAALRRTMAKIKGYLVGWKHRIMKTLT